MRNIDSRIRSFGFKSCPLLADWQLVGDFCNTIGPSRTLREVRNRRLGPGASLRTWGKQHGTMRKTKHRGIRGVTADFMLNLIAYNLIRIPKLIAA
jgi:hypothetical protein